VEKQPGSAELSQVESFKAYAVIIVIALSLPWEVWIRKRFGERYFNSWSIAIASIGLIAFNMFATFGERIRSLTGGSIVGAPLLYLYTLGFFALLAYHRFVIWQRNKAGEEWHSYCAGDSHPFWLRFGFDKVDTVQRFLEPLLGIAIGFLLMILRIDPHCGAFIAAAGFGMALKETHFYYMQRNQYLDLRDAEIMSEHYTKMRQARRSGESLPDSTKGFMVRGIPRNPKQQDAFISIIEKLDPNLQSLLESGSGETKQAVGQ